MTERNKHGAYIIPESYERIKKSNLETGDIILFSHGNRLTEIHGKWRKKKYGQVTLPPYHAAMFYKKCGRDYLIVDPEVRTTLSHLEEYTHKSSIRIDIIKADLTSDERKQLQVFAKKATTEEHYYDFKGYGSFLSEMPLVGWIGKLIPKPSKKNFFCSDFVASAYESISCPISSKKGNFTAPIDILIYAIENDMDISTLKLRGEIIS